MLGQFIYSAIISIAVIAIIHYLYNFFKDNLTSPKIKDFVDVPTQQYNDIYNTIKHSSSTSQDIKSDNMNTNNNSVDQNPYTIKNVGNIVSNENMNINPIMDINGINDINNNQSQSQSQSQNLGFIAQYKPEQEMQNELRAFVKSLEVNNNQEPIPHNII